MKLSIVMIDDFPSFLILIEYLQVTTVMINDCFHWIGSFKKGCLGFESSRIEVSFIATKIETIGREEEHYDHLERRFS